jgi:hypothetical protein
MIFMTCLRSISLLEHLIERNRNLAKARELEAETAAQNGDRTRQSISSTEAARHSAVWHELRLVLDEYRLHDEQLLQNLQQLVDN